MVRMFALAAMMAAGITTWMYWFDWFGIGSSGNGPPPFRPWPSKALFAYRLCGAVLISWLACGLGWWVRRSSSRVRLLFLAWLVPAAVLYVAAWPGYMLTDSVAAIRFGLLYPVDLWLGFFQPFFYATILQLVPHIAAILLIQLIVVAALLAHVSECLLVLTRRRLIVVLWAALLISSPAMVANFGLLTRDMLFCTGVVWLAVFILRAANGHSPEPMECLFGGGVAAVVAVTRGDGWFVAIPFLIAVACVVKGRRALSAAAVMFLVAAVYGVFLPAQLGDHKDDFNYNVANTLNPLGYVLQSRFHTDRLGNVSHIAKVVDVDKIVKLQTPYEIPAWWEGDIVEQPGDSKERRDYMRHVAGLLRENIGIFLAGRVETLVAAAGMAQEGFRFGDAFVQGWPIGWLPPRSVNLDLDAGRPFPKIAEALRGFLYRTTLYHRSGFSGSVLCWNFLPWLVILLCAPYFRTEYRGLMWVVLIGCSRVPIVFLGAPAAQFKYYLPVYMLGTLLFVILVAHVLSVFGASRRLRRA